MKQIDASTPGPVVIPVAIHQGFIAIKCNERVANFFTLHGGPGEQGRDQKPRHWHHLRRNQQTELPPDSRRATPEGTHGRIHHQSRTIAALRDTLLPKLQKLQNGELRVAKTVFSPADE